MLSKNVISHLGSLKTKKFREEHREFIAEGHKLVTELCTSDFKIKTIYALTDWFNENHSQPLFYGHDCREVTESEMKKISGFTSPPPVLALVEMPEQPPPETFGFSENSSLLLALDDIRDPGNLGTIIRIADWFGIPRIFCSPNCVELYNPKVIQATMGSITRVKLYHLDLVPLLSGFIQNGTGKVYGAFPDGTPVHKIKPERPCLLLIGNESRGISKELIPFITKKISIPSYGTSLSGKAESLNASVATGILCAEFRRQSTK